MIHPTFTQTDLSYQERFLKVAQAHPNHHAVVDGTLSKSYAQLNEESRGLSNVLRTGSVGTQDLVVIYMSSSYEYICACLATLRAGAAFLPVPIDLPLSQLELILEDAKPKVILSQPQFKEKLEKASFSKSSIILEVTPELLASNDDQFNEKIKLSEAKLIKDGLSLDYCRSEPNHYAFATYTSGTTGKPKGVLQIQSALLASYDARHRFNPYQNHERVACNVFFMWEILRPLLVGGTTIVIPDALLAMPKKLCHFLSAREVTEVLFTPSAFQRLIRSVPAHDLKLHLNGLRTIWLNGEVVTTKLVKEALALIPPHIKLLNTYSICECHDVSNSDLRSLDYEYIEEKYEGICPVGYPDAGVVVKVKNNEGLKDEGIGELYISGHGLGAGYLHLEHLTAERFPKVAGVHYYATGDLAELSSDGLITIKGRLGTMVKMRGYSVYLNSIEEALRLHPAIQDARVFLRGDHLSQHLSAFIVGPKEELKHWLDEQKQTASALKQWLAQHVAPYMIPNKWIRLDYFPVHHISGKLDQQALWDLEKEYKQSLDDLAHAPQSTREECLELMRKLWARALELDLEVVQTDSDFYDLGGHSLSMVDLVSSVEQVFGLKLDGDELYENPRLDLYASLIFKDRFENGIASLAQNQVESKDRRLNLNLPSNLENRQQRKEKFWDSSDLDLNWPESSLIHSYTLSEHSKTLLSNAGAILITGVTGHLGLSLLEALLNRAPQSAQLICLVRPKLINGSRTSGLQRLKLRFQQANLGDLSDALYQKRLSVLEGDITQTQLGINEVQYERLCRKVDIVYHAAAFVNLRASYEQMKSSIVDGSRNILYLCAQSRLKTLHYISTNSVALPDESQNRNECFVDENIAKLIQDGYSQAKWIAESLMKQAISLGIPTTIYRPGNIGPHQASAYFNQNDLSILIWNACKRQRSAPQNTNWLFELTPVDQVAQLILSISNLKQAQSIYHLVHPKPIAANELFKSWYARGWLTSQKNDWKTWKQELLGSSHSKDKIVGTSLDYFNKLLIDEHHFSIENLYSDLPNEAKLYDQEPQLHRFFTKLFYENSE